MRQKTELEITLQAVATGEARSSGMEGTEARTAKTKVESQAALGPLMEVIVERDNLRKALAHVKRNKGAAGIDGMSLDALAPHLKEHWPAIRAQLLEGTYKPQPVRRVEIPKASGGTRSLGIPTVFDRVNHDILMGLVAKRVADKRVLKLIRGFLTAGVLMDGLVGPTEEGTPQG